MGFVCRAKFAAAEGGAIYVSTNSGLSWSETGAPIGGWQAIASSSDGLTLAAVQGIPGGSLYTSTNGGATWQVASLPEIVTHVAMSADGTKIATGSVGEAYPSTRIYISTDSGASWAVRTNSGRRFSIAWSPDGTTLGAVGYGIRLSTDLGETWQSVGESAIRYGSVVLSSDASVLLAAGLPVYNFGLYVSTDKGRTWTTVDVPWDYWLPAMQARNAAG